MSWSQANEEEIILEFFKGRETGRFLDIGAYDGKTFSNTFALAEKGWKGVCVEASPQCFTQLQKTHRGNKNVELVCCAIGIKSRLSVFYDSGGAVASLSKTHMEKWKEDQKDFMEIYIVQVDVQQLLQLFPTPFHFISLDIEGESLDVLACFPDLRELGTELICVEALDVEQASVDEIMKTWGFALYVRAGENLFYRRP